jgi:hypothetical protein
MRATWSPNRRAEEEEGVADDLLVDDSGVQLARVEDFGYACYPCAINAKTGNLERGGPTKDRVEARLWCERVAGLRPARPGDERPPFYYSEED